MTQILNLHNRICSAHAEGLSLEAIAQMFGGRVIDCGVWPGIEIKHTTYYV